MKQPVATECPTSRELTTFANGQLDESLAEVISAHLEVCGECQAAVDRLTPLGDSLVHALRRQTPEWSPRSARLDKLIEAVAVRETLPPSSSRTKQSGSKIDSVSLEEFVEGVQQSGVVNPAEVETWLHEMQPADARAFASALVESEKLTEFQAHSILQGRRQHLVIGNYVLLEPLGEGGMGRVFKAKHRQLGRMVCLKVLHAADRKLPQLVERFRREAKTVAALSHPNIVVAHDADEEDGIPYLAMEFIDGKDLARYIEEHGALAPCDAAQVILQSARALEYAHSRGVVHRDVKPSNLLLASEQRDSSSDSPLVKVLDLGLARFDSFLGNHPDALTHASMTSTGVVMGTVDYMSPEQALNSRKANHRSDIYSLGCTLYFLVTGRVAYMGETVMEKLIAHRERDVPSLIEAGAEVPASLDAIFQQMVAKSPDDRYASMSAVAEDVELFLEGKLPVAMQRAGAPIVVEAPSLASSQRLRRKRMIGTCIGVAAILMVMLAGAWTVAYTDWRAALIPIMPLTANRLEPPVQVPLGLTNDVQPERTLVGHEDTMANGGPGRVLLVVPHANFFDDHYQQTTNALENNGIVVQVASSTMDAAKPKYGKIKPIQVHLTPDKFDPDDFDAVVFLGGKDVREFTHKGGKVGKHTKAMISSSLDKGRVVAGIGNGWDVVRDTGLCQECELEPSGQLQKGCPNDDQGSIFLVAQGSADAGELVDTMLAELQIDRP